MHTWVNQLHVCADRDMLGCLHYPSCSILRIAPGAVALPDPSQQLQQQASGTAAPPRTRWGFFPLLKHLTTRNPDEVPAAALGAPPSPFAAADEQLGPAPWDGEESDIERLDSWGSLPGGGRQQAAYGRGDWSALVQCRRQQQREALAHVVRLRHAAIVIQVRWLPAVGHLHAMSCTSSAHAC
jgi:hypothetical protein